MTPWDPYYGAMKPDKIRSMDDVWCWCAALKYPLGLLALIVPAAAISAAIYGLILYLAFG